MPCWGITISGLQAGDAMTFRHSVLVRCGGVSFSGSELVVSMGVNGCELGLTREPT